VRELGHVLGGHPQRGQRRGGRLENAPHLEEIQHRVVAVEVHDEAQRLEQQGRREAGRVRAVALPHVQHVDQAERLHRLSQRVAGQAQLGGQVGLPGQFLPGPHAARDDHLLDLLDRVVGQRHAPPPAPPPGVPIP